MRNLLQDVRYGFRMLLKRPGFTAIAVLTLALAIGANTAIFSIVNAVLLRPLPFREPERLAMLWETHPQTGRMGVAGENFREWQKQTQTLEGITLFANSDFDLAGDGEPERVQGTAATANFFSIVKAEATLGRTFLEGDDRPEAPRVVILSYGLWQRRYGGDRNVIGKTLKINGESASIIGVMPQDFSSDSQLWTPFVINPNQPISGGRSFSAMARLKPGVTVQQAQAEMDTIARRLESARPEFNTGWGIQLVPLMEQVVGWIRPALFVLLGVVGFVLLIACANVANLLLARAAGRQKELAIRAAIGASHLHIMRQLLTESMLLALLGGALGLLIALWGVDLLVALSPNLLPRAKEIGIDKTVLGFTVLLSLLTGIFFGLAPALQHSRPNLNELLKEGKTTSGAGFGHRRLGSALVVAEVAIALVLLIGAGLMLRSFLHLTRIDPGFNPQHALTMQISLSEAKYKEDQQTITFYTEALERLRALPGVEAVGTTHVLPLSGTDSSRPFIITGRPLPEAGKETGASYRVISPDYFRAMGIPLLQGRDFNQHDTAETSGVVMINSTLARRNFGGEDPVGKQMRQGAVNSQTPWLTIVGVVADVRHGGLDTEPRPEMYFPYSQIAMQQSNSISKNSRRITLVIRTASDPSNVAAAARREILGIDKEQPVTGVRTLADYVSGWVAPQRFNLLLLSIFAGLALLLAAIGVYGVIAYGVAQRTHEIGIRMALGARTRDVLGMVVKQGMTLVLIGIGLGLVGAYILTRVMSKLLFGISATDPLTFAGVALLLIVVAFIACLIPARRATKVDPMIALRYE
ncbi:MAG: ABC transporter permease [Pyrinomonadaceae bacterium]